MDATHVTIPLPKPEAVFLEEYTERHKLTVAELFYQFVKQLQRIEKYSFHPDIKKFAGMIPKDVDVRKEYYEYLEEKHK